MLNAKKSLTCCHINKQQQHQFNGHLSGTKKVSVSQYQKGKTNLDLLEQESEWHLHQLGHTQICT